MKQSENFKKHSKTRSIIALCVCILINIFQLIAFVIDVGDLYHHGTPESGVHTFRMFTTLSNLLVAIASVISIPYFIDDIRHKTFYYPRWLMTILYIGTEGVALTFVSAITLISANLGFVKAMLTDSSLFLHTFVPLLSMSLFLFIKPHYRFKFIRTLLPMIPVVAYTILYFIMAVLIGPENGGWRDHYSANTIMPWYFSAPMILGLAYGISVLLWFVHNKMSKRLDQEFYDYYLVSDRFEADTIEEAVARLAEDQYEDSKSSFVKVPIRILALLQQRFKSDLSIETLSQLYVSAILNKQAK